MSPPAGDRGRAAVHRHADLPPFVDLPRQDRGKFIGEPLQALRLLVLATVGSAGPFIGLFGTVWGIMTSFRAIAGQQTTSLAVVAPGIAEALFATAIGLVAAIPATIFYNKFVSDVNRQAQRLEGFADEFAAILSRQIDERG